MSKDFIFEKEEKKEEKKKENKQKKYLITGIKSFSYRKKNKTFSIKKGESKEIDDNLYKELKKIKNFQFLVMEK